MVKSVDPGIRRIMTSGTSVGCYRKIVSTNAKYDEDGMVAPVPVWLFGNGVPSDLN